MRKIVLIDFEDSFTFNIASEFSKNDEVEVLSWKELLIEPKVIESFDLLVLGPGPGHPDEYREIFPIIKNILNLKSKKMVGICLGHQIILRCQGFEIKKSKNPIHGQKVNLPLTQQWKKILKTDDNSITVQRYNSLAVVGDVTNSQSVLLFDDQNEIQASYHEKLLTYQFHPESIGTTYPQMFFSLC